MLYSLRFFRCQIQRDISLRPTMQYIQFSSFAVALLTGSALALPSSDNPKRDAAASSYSAAAYVTPTATYQYHYTSTPTPNYSAPSDGSEDSDVYVPETMIEEALVDYICSAIEYYSEEGESDSDSPYSPSNSTSYSDNSESSEDYSEDTTSYSDIVQSPLEEVSFWRVGPIVTRQKLTKLTRSSSRSCAQAISNQARMAMIPPTLSVAVLPAPGLLQSISELPRVW